MGLTSGKRPVEEEFESMPSIPPRRIKQGNLMGYRPAPPPPQPPSLKSQDIIYSTRIFEEEIKVCPMDYPKDGKVGVATLLFLKQEDLFRYKNIIEIANHRAIQIMELEKDRAVLEEKLDYVEGKTWQEWNAEGYVVCDNEYWKKNNNCLRKIPAAICITAGSVFISFSAGLYIAGGLDKLVSLLACIAISGLTWLAITHEAKSNSV